jgi:septum formation protein
MQRRLIILASESPRRKELLALTGLKFRVVTSDYEEDMSRSMSPHKLARFLSYEKAQAVAACHKNAVIIAADTFILINGKLLGKPHTHKEARKMLKLLNGRSHSVITGYTIIDTAENISLSRSVGTKVWLRNLTDREIDAYVESGEPLDKAGAYAIQGLGSVLVKKIEGDYFNVIGLPLSSLAKDLKNFGICIL